jgi:tRNA (adenine37-N6)-methyltransferase
MPNDDSLHSFLPLFPIGRVETTIPDHEIATSRHQLVSDIVIFPRYLRALNGLDDYSHLIVLFFMDRSTPKDELEDHPRGDPQLPLTGVLAMRGRAHPNPIGLAVVDLVARSGCRLQVRRLDAYNGTPVIDIKPYDFYDSYADIRVPDWVRARTRRANGQS